MENTGTPIEWSKDLLKWGINPDTADMGWNIFSDGSTRLLPIDDWDLTKDGSNGVEFVPSWTIGALMNQLPEPHIWHGFIGCHCEIRALTGKRYSSPICGDVMTAIMECIRCALQDDAIIFLRH